MLFQNAHIIFILIQICIFIKLSISEDMNNIRVLNEVNQTDEIKVKGQINEIINNINQSSEIYDINKALEINSPNQASKINGTNIINETNVRNEDNNTNKIYETNKTNEINGGENQRINEMIMFCSSLSDCFNCTVVQYCRWQNESCVLYRPFYQNYSIPALNESYQKNSIEILSPYVNFIRKSCFLDFTPFLENDNSPIYNNISTKYCGKHYITNHLSNYSKEFKIELNNISGIYGVPNILCEYIILSGPNYFDVNIELNEKDAKNFYLLYSENSLQFYDHINESKTFSVGSTSRKANTFIYYGLKALNSSPFKITFKEQKKEESSQTTGYILIVLIALIVILIVISIIYIRCNSEMFKSNKTNIQEEEEKIKDKTDYNIKGLDNTQKIKINNDNNTLQLNTTNAISNIGSNTPDDLKTKDTQKQFFFGNTSNSEFNNIYGINLCCFDNLIINNVTEIYKAKCGHLYHFNCFHKLIENNIATTGNLEFRCLSCREIIYP